MNINRVRNYADLDNWKPIFQNRNVTFINLQSTDYKDDIKKILKSFNVEVINFSELDQYNDLAEVAALSAALDMCISIATAASTISAAVGTKTIIPTWRQSPWNNSLFASRGPNIDLVYRNSWESWEKVFNHAALKVKNLN
jgi:hypothetical protein